MYPEGDHGNALLSKFPIARFHNHDFSMDGDEKRGVLHAVLTSPDHVEEIHAVCIHFGLLEKHRVSQLALLCELLKTIPPTAPLVVAGDFNDWRLRAHSILTACASLREVFVQAYGSAAKTFPALLPTLRLDRIYVRNAETHRPIVLPRKPWSHLSDHAPLVAEILL